MVQALAVRYAYDKEGGGDDEGDAQLVLVRRVAAQKTALGHDTADRDDADSGALTFVMDEGKWPRLELEADLCRQYLSLEDYVERGVDDAGGEVVGPTVGVGLAH